MDVLSCGWDSAKFLIFSENVFDPLIYYSHLGPILVSLALLVLVFFGNRKELSNKILILLISFFCLWSFFDLILWASEKSEYIMFFWSSMILIDLLIYVSAFYFIHVFIYKKDISFLAKILIFLTYLPLIIFSLGDYNLSFFDLTNCDREAHEGILWSYTYIVEIIFILLILVESAVKSIEVIKLKNSRLLKEIFLVTSGMALFLIAFSWGNISGSITEDWSIGQYGLFGAPIFIGFLTYAIVKYQALNIKTMAVQVFIVAIMLFIGMQFFFIRTNLNRLLTVVTLVLVATFGLMLVRSIKKEIERKEELQKMTNALAVANDKLRTLDNAKSEFISIASHQLRTPLTAIKGFISLLLEGSYGRISKEVQDVLNKVYLSNERLIDLVENMLNLSRIESGRMEYTFEKVDIGKLCAEVYDTFIIRAKEKKLYLDFKLPENSLVEVETDRNKLREVISNLVDNALKYTLKGGVKIRLQESSSGVRVAVSDTGIGVPKEELPYLFQKFSRGKDVSRLNTGGTGLGLHVGKKMIEALHGQIWVESAGANLGSTFTIEVPFKIGE